MTALSTAPVEETQRSRIDAKTVRIARLLLAAGWKHSASIAERRDDFGAPEGWGILTHSWVRDLDVIEAFYNVCTEDDEIPAEFLSAHWRPAADDSGVGFWNPGTLDRMPTEQIVDLLVALKVLPFYLSSAYSEGHTDGRNSVVFDLSHVAEFGEHEFGDPDERHVDAALLSARTYWLKVLAQRAVELDRPLEPLFDRKPYPRQRQRESVVDAVREVLKRD